MGLARGDQVGSGGGCSGGTRGGAAGWQPTHPPERIASKSPRQWDAHLPVHLHLRTALCSASPLSVPCTPGACCCCRAVVGRLGGAPSRSFYASYAHADAFFGGQPGNTSDIPRLVAYRPGVIRHDISEMRRGRWWEALLTNTSGNPSAASDQTCPGLTRDMLVPVPSEPVLSLNCDACFCWPCRQAPVPGCGARSGAGGGGAGGGGGLAGRALRRRVGESMQAAARGSSKESPVLSS